MSVITRESGVRTLQGFVCIGGGQLCKLLSLIISFYCTSEEGRQERRWCCRLLVGSFVLFCGTASVQEEKSVICTRETVPNFVPWRWKRLGLKYLFFPTKSI